MTVIVYRWMGDKVKELFRVTGNTVSNDYGKMFLDKLGIPVDEDAVYEKVRSNMVYLVVRVND